jgi:hypothetical protein
MDERQLGWVKRNRAVRPGGQRVGALAKAILTSPKLANGAWRGRLISILDRHAGAELLTHATPVDAKGGVLTLRVQEPALLYQLRLAWEQRLIEMFRAELPGAGIHTVRFVCGPNAG